MDGRTMDTGRTDDRPWLYYKLTNEPKGSGELKTKVSRMDTRTTHTDGRTDGQMDGRTTWKQYTPSQTKFAGGIIIYSVSLIFLEQCISQ